MNKIASVVHIMEYVTLSYRNPIKTDDMYRYHQSKSKTKHWWLWWLYTGIVSFFIVTRM